MITGAPLPAVTEDSAGFWEGTAAGELRIQRCSNCGRLRFPPRPMCPYCNSLDHTWDALSGRGRVWSFVVAKFLTDRVDHRAARGIKRFQRSTVKRDGATFIELEVTEFKGVEKLDESTFAKPGS